MQSVVGVHRRVDVVNGTAILGDRPAAALNSRTGPKDWTEPFGAYLDPSVEERNGGND